MKILLYSDNHWSQYSSIVRKRGEKYSLRLENQIESLNWAMRLAEDNQCFATFCLGDFFDKAELNAEEISALKDVKWAGMSNYFIAGNHEMGIVGHEYSSSKLFNLLDTGYVFTEPESLILGGIEICILPYILEDDRKTIQEYFKVRTDKKRLILSHNDFKGLPMGKFISQEGFDINDVEANCDLCINGHLHNGQKISEKIINIGNLTGQNFGEDANLYDHCAFIVDTDTLRVEVYENPYAFNFYKIDVTKWAELGELQVKRNTVCTVKCKQRDLNLVKDWLAHTQNVIESRIIIEPEIVVNTEEIVESFAVDHLEQFKEYILNNIENTDALLKELNEVCK